MTKEKIKKIASKKPKIEKKKLVSHSVAVKFNNITKIFGTNVANDEINFDVYKNEIHAVLGENGAGKSTLMSILFGLYTPTSGNIMINGIRTKIENPRHANELKIAMLPQHFKLVENMTVWENVVLGYEKIHAKEGSIFTILKTIAEQFKIDIDLKAKVSDLPISQKQKVEILKILWKNADIIIFDEPTSILTPQEVVEFLKMIKYMKSIGKTILLITHKLPEIKEVADRVTVIRKGKYISTKKVSKTTTTKMAKMMVGKAVNLNLSTIKKVEINKEAKNNLIVKNLSYKATGYETTLKNLNFSIKKGEILGIAAIEGNGQAELIKALAGINKFSGDVEVAGFKINNTSIKERYYNYKGLKNMNLEYKKSLKDSIKIFQNELILEKSLLNDALYLENINKRKERVKRLKIQVEHAKILKNKPKSLISHIPEDRHLYGLVLDYSIGKNAILQDIDFYTKFGFVSKRDINKRTDYFINKYDIKGATNNKLKIRALSGGNQQKLILAREIEREPKLLLASHLSRGLDVGAIRNVYESLVDSRNKGMSVLLNSGELDEIMQISDRIMILHDGKIVSISEKNELTKVQIGALMAGGKK